MKRRFRWHILIGPMLAIAAAGAQAQSPSQPQWRESERRSQFVRMSDGTNLAVDVQLPREFTGPGPRPAKFPAIFRYTSYGRSNIDLQTGKVPPHLTYFVERGYVVVSADMRGTGASEGWMNQMSDEIRHDGKALVDWIAAQPWSNGRVGMTGGSYEGWSQLAVASMKPTALKAIAPRNPGWDGLKTRPGGVLSYAFMQTWSSMMYHLNRGDVFPPFPWMTPAPPVLDEDGDGELLDEIPVDLDGDGWFHDDYAWPLERGPTPVYPDGTKRTTHAYLRAIMQHHADPAGAPGDYDGFTLADAMRFRDTRRAGDGLNAADLNWNWFPAIRDSGVAVLHHGGWFDPFIRSSFELYSTLAGTNPARIVATPTWHQGIAPDVERALGASGQLNRFDDELAWFDHWLKGVDNGIERAPPVKLFVVNAGWREAKQWPLAEEKKRLLHLSSERTLSATADGSGEDRYLADFTHYSGWGPTFDTAPVAAVNKLVPRDSPVSNAFWLNRHFMFGVPESVPARTELDRKALTYTSAPLDQDTDVIGHPIVHLWASSTADDGDFFFYLEDVAPDGEAVLVTEYQHRAGFARLRSNNEMVPAGSGVDVKPELPWHGFKQADYDGQVFAGGRVVEVVTALYPTAWRFRRGHSIRLSIAAADWPAFELHPQLSPRNRPDASDNTVPVVTIHRGGPHASRIELPVVQVEH